jgi:hypothetical protein
MVKFILLLLALAFIVPTADAQSFYKRKRKFKRAYIATAITGAVYKPHRGPNPEEATFGTSSDGVEDIRDRSPRGIRRERRRNERIARQEARDIAKAENRKFSKESRVLGQHLAANQSQQGMTWRMTWR